ncbi:beta-glucosidase [Dysgonomonas macrotermitis]|uniref:Beta-glucosidase n=1 Tax=Dysgonomonas macrotermitis TaxID=1346286 RepID=A0A1M4VQN8_9BACT|nr:glycoside hydrolase family 3 C-terminal domain-containing protein [Dysgonomonas macrotermitis]SHE71185.1 beta-glucosidase [Dysgonomonas macrotermitis]
MNKILFYTAFSCVCCFSTISVSYAQKLPQLGKDPVEKVVKAMTLEEKARLVVGTSKSQGYPPPPAPGTVVYDNIQQNVANTFQTKEKVKGAAGDSYAIPRLGIPSIVYADGPAGVRIDSIREGDSRKYNATAFPIATLLASSWNPQLVREVGEVMGKEVLEYGIDILLAPGMNIQRNPLTGRNFEYYSEDPLVTGKIASAMVNGIQSNGVGTSIKHFVANNQETYRNGVNAIVSERALREIYLKGFEIAVKESNPWTIMSSYNKLNGTYTSESYNLLTKLLREEWGYKGFVMTDWWAENDPVAQMKAGNDLLMPGEERHIQRIIKAVEDGELDERILDRNVINILNIVQKGPAYRNYSYSDMPDLDAHTSIVRKSASEGMVLLENKDNTLPIQKEIKKAALFGVSSYEMIIGGYGSGYVYYPHKISLEKGLKDAGLVLDSKQTESYINHIAQEKAKWGEIHFWYVPTVPEMYVDKNEIERLANESEIAILTIGRNSGEGGDRQLIKGDYYLNDVELDLVKNVSSAFRSKGKKTVVVLNIGGVIEMTEWKDLPDAILLAWQPGQEAGYSITDVLTGTVNPSGKLTMTFPKRYEDVPSASNFPQSDNNPSFVKYVEDIFVGYRHYNTFNVQSLYEFGYGLSYTDFEYSNLKLDFNTSKGEINISVTVKNTGKVAGKEIAQLYVNAPTGEIKRPTDELRGFAKTKLLQSRESQTLLFKLSGDDLARFDENQSAWITDAGKYTIKVGSSSKKILLSKVFEKKSESKRGL